MPEPAESRSTPTPPGMDNRGFQWTAPGLAMQANGACRDPGAPLAVHGSVGSTGVGSTEARSLGRRASSQAAPRRRPQCLRAAPSGRSSGLPSARSAQAAYSAKSRGHEAHYAAHKGSRVGCDIVTVTPMHHRSDSDFALIQVWAPVYFPFGCDGPGFRCTVSDRSPGLRGTLLNPGAEAP